MSIMVGMTGFEPATPSSRTKCTTKLCYIPIPFLLYATFENLQEFFKLFDQKVTEMSDTEKQSGNEWIIRFCCRDIPAAMRRAEECGIMTAVEVPKGRKGSHMKIGVVSLGCCKNLVDSERIMGLLTGSGHEIVSDVHQAEAIIVNTCGFIESAKEEAINTILEMAEYKQEHCRKLIVCGCLAQRYKTELAQAIPEVDCYITLREYPQMSRILSQVLEQPVAGEYGKNTRLVSTKPWTAYLKIAEGCDNRCSYCAIPGIRGGYVSFPMEDLIAEATTLAKQGVKELVVIAQDTSRYGTDLYGRRRIWDLLRELNNIDGLHWIRVLYLYPDEIDDEFVTGIRDLDKVIPYFDIPVQHGSDKMLQLMNRRGSIESILRTVRLIRQTYSMPVLRTTMIVGFPQESEEDFQKMLDFVREVRWDRLGAFTYSREEQTPAYTMEGQISQEIMDRRLQQRMCVQNEIAQKNSEALVGQTLEVLIENQDGLTGMFHGRGIHSAPDGIDGVIKFRACRPHEMGTFTMVRITRARHNDLIGEEVAETETAAA